jgi:uracil-DNA glycosylase family 4
MSTKTETDVVSLAQEVANQYGVTEEWAKDMILTQPVLLSRMTDTGIATKIMLPGISIGQGHWDDTSNEESQRVWVGLPGPRPHKIMLVNCWPNKIEEQERSLMRGSWVDEFKNLCKNTNFGTFASDIYLTCYCKYAVDGKKVAIPKEDVITFKEYFLRELELVKPDIVIACGAKTLKALFGAKATFEHYKGRTVEADKNEYGVKITTIPDFSAILHVPEQREVIALELNRIANELGSAPTNRIKEDYTYCYTLDELKKLVDDVRKDYTGWISVDCEWGGPNHIDGYLRCIQFSWAPGQAAVVVFHKANKEATEIGGSPELTWAILRELLEDKSTKLIGHFIRADMPWLVHSGIDVSNSVLNGWDTALAGHLLNENWAQGLETYVARHTDMGRYEVELYDWIKQNKYDVDEFGYGGIPDEILFPYGARDADATFRIALIQMTEMDIPSNARIKELYQSIVMPASMPILEMEITGINVDKSRLEYLSQKYTEKKRELTEQLCVMLNWPEFNPDSPAQKAAALFSWKKKCKPPADANLWKYTPVKATNDADWEKAEKDGKTGSLVPSTDRSVLLQLIGQNKECKLLNTLLIYTAISQNVKTFTGQFTENDDGTFSLNGGIMDKVWTDGRVHSRIRQTVETGRYGHSSPNMAQLPKTAEDLISTAFKNEPKIAGIRSCFTADPGWCIIDSDWVQAELFVMAWLSDDHVMQAKLLDKGSDFHSEVAIQMFRLDNPPEGYAKGKKEWLKENGWSKFRTIAKTITFGIAYGRGATAIKAAVGLEGINITQEEAEDSVNKFKTTFPDLTMWLQEQQENVLSQGYVENGFGRRRRFEKTNDKEGLAHQRRQAMNAPIQGTVGDLMSLALLNLYLIRTKERPHLKYKIIMSVHDQILVTCPVDQVEETLEVMDIAMCERCKIPGSDLLLSSDPEVCLRWGEPLTEEDVAKYPTLGKYLRN